MNKPIEPTYQMLGLKIRQIRETLGLTQEDLAKKIGLERTSVVNTETGRQRVLLHTVDEYAKALGTTPKHLLRGIWWVLVLVIAISLLSAGPADAAHHQRAHRETATHRALGGAGSNPAGSTTMQHSAVPMPRERPAAAWTAPQATVAQQLVLVGMWRLQTDQFYRR